MKKLLLAGLVSLVAIGMLATGVVFAQTSTPTPTPTQTSQLAQTPVAPGQGGGMMGGRGGMMGKRGDGPLRTYFEQALAAKLSLTDAQLQEKLTAGQTPDEIVQATGVAAADVPALLQEVHKAAIASAVTAGVITQAQADEMLLHNNGMLGKRGNSPIRTYVDQALAAKLGITEAQLQEKLTAGQTPVEIVQESGVAAVDVPALLQEVHKTAIANAVTAGVITQAQADEMIQHIQDHPEGKPGMRGGHGHGGRGGQNP